MTHSIAAMAETLRADPGTSGGERRRHAHEEARLRSVVHRRRAWRWPTRRRSWQPTPVGIAGSPRGTGHRGHLLGAPRARRGARAGPAGLDVAGGGRCYALLDGGAAALAEAETDELVGRRVTLTPQDQVNMARLP